MYTPSRTEVRAMLAAIDLSHPFGVRDYALFQFAFYTGLRVCELSGLTLHDVAHHSVPRDAVHVRAHIAKGGRPRTVALNTRAQAAVRALVAFNTRRGLRTDPEAPLFQTRCHGPLTIRAIQRLCVALRTKAGLASVTPHSFRHAFGTQLARVANLLIVQQALGHAWSSSTQRYVHPSIQEQRQALQRMV